MKTPSLDKEADPMAGLMGLMKVCFDTHQYNFASCMLIINCVTIIELRHETNIYDKLCCLHMTCAVV